MRNTHEWWTNLTLKEQADYVERQMRKRGKTPDRDLVIENLVKQGQYKGNGSERYTELKKEIHTKVKTIGALATEIWNDLKTIDSETVDKMELWEFDGDSVRKDYFGAVRAVDRLDNYFHDERWDAWSGVRDEELGVRK